MKKVAGNLILCCLIAVVAGGASVTAFAQSSDAIQPSAPATSASYDTAGLSKSRENWIVGGDTNEKSIAVAPNVSVTLCVVQGKLRINGWSRNEVRVFVKDGSNISFKVREKSVKDDKPIWISAIGYDPKRVNKSFPDCIWGENIEIDVPQNASIEVKGQETEASIDSVRKISIKNIGGDISVRNVTGAVTASTYEGDITVEASQGQMTLDTSTGNITAFEVWPDEIGDSFRAKTNSGAIALQSVGHRNTEVTSISGSVSFIGEIRAGGSYVVNTTNGSIRLSLPQTTACKISAVYGYGTFASELPFKIETENISAGPVKSVVGSLGAGGEALMRLSTNNGSISIKKN